MPDDKINLTYYTLYIKSIAILLAVKFNIKKPVCFVTNTKTFSTDKTFAAKY